MSDLTTREAAVLCKTTPKTLKRWVRQEGYNLPVQGRGRFELRFPDWLIEKILNKRRPRVAR